MSGIITPETLMLYLELFLIKMRETNSRKYMRVSFHHLPHSELNGEGTVFTGVSLVPPSG